jgi:hypothetical protein
MKTTTRSLFISTGDSDLSNATLHTFTSPDGVFQYELRDNRNLGGAIQRCPGSQRAFIEASSEKKKKGGASSRKIEAWQGNKDHSGR